MREEKQREHIQLKQKVEAINKIDFSGRILPENWGSVRKICNEYIYGTSCYEPSPYKGFVNFNRNVNYVPLIQKKDSWVAETK